MLEQNQVMLKEWAAVVLALRNGRQSILLRKGGIAEGPAGFAIEHDEFWLLPTYLHQSEAGLADDACDLLQAADSIKPQPGRARIDTYATVDQVWHIGDERQLAALRPFHVLSDATVAQRFHYRQPGLYVAAVRVFRTDTPVDIEETPELAGCKSWGEFSQTISTHGLCGVQEQHSVNDARLAELRCALNGRI